jgi:ribosomal protein S12 methylthiotransferase
MPPEHHLERPAPGRSQNSRKVGCISLGCPKNQLDSEVMLGLLQQAGYTLVPEDEAEILIVNTCGFIQAAKEEAIQTTLEAAQYKQHGPCRVLIMAGCFAQRYARDLVTELPEVDLFIGLDDVPRIVEICQSLDQQTSTAPRMSAALAQGGPSVYLYDHQMPRLRFGRPHTAYVKIAEGCRYQCAFCAIPMIRGHLRSRPLDSIVHEAAALTEQGVQEIVLIAQDTTSYGLNLAGKPLIVPLLERLVSLKTTRWIRLMYAYPTSLDLPLLHLIASEPKICAYLDLPLQHIDDTILQRMRRAISEARTRRLLEQLRAEIPNLTLRTSFIVGFPGETETAFQKLEAFVRDAQFDRIGVFTYSREDGTPAYTLPDQIPSEVAAARRDRLMRMQADISLAKHQALVGATQTVLVDGVSAETPLLLESRTAGQAPEIDGVVYINEGQTAAGAFEQVLITEALPHDLVGALVEQPA